MEYVKSDQGSWQNRPLGITLRLYTDYATLLERVVTSLKQEGFVVLTDIDIKETLKRKLNIETLPFKILRVYHPQLTANAHLAVPDAALLPYNIIVAQMEDGAVEISISDPLPLFTIAENPALKPFIGEAYTRLQFLADWWRKIH